jgi:hypothetical protein
MSGKEELPERETEPIVRQPGLRFLEAAVYTMGGLLVLMLVGLLGGIAWKATHRVAAPPDEMRLLDLGLPAGSAVQSMQLDGDRLALNTGTEIIVVDIRKNAVVSRIEVAPR